MLSLLPNKIVESRTLLKDFVLYLLKVDDYSETHW